MKFFRIIRGPVLLIMAAVFFFMGYGCSDKIVGTDQDITVRVPVSYKPAQVVVVLIVTASDFEPKFVYMNYVDGYLVGTVSVPAGTSRLFTIQAQDLNGRVIYVGADLVDIGAGDAVELEILMYPIVPVINFTPHYQSGEMGADYTVDVNIFNMPTLHSLAMMITRNESPGYFDTIEMGADIDDIDYYSTYYYDYYSQHVYITDGTVGDTLYPLTNYAGNAHLATVRYNSYYDWGYDTATSVFNVEVMALYDVSGDTLPIDSVYVDEASIFMEAPIEFK